MLLIAVMVKLTSSGTVIFTQTRIGIDRRRKSRPVDFCRRRVDHGGKPFRVFKFRTMYQTDGEQDLQVWACPDDPRVTPVGRSLRRCRFDELPQLFNVLCGDMNLVGPRPEQPRIFAELRTRIHGYQDRQRVRPGITGNAQVKQNYDRSISDVENKIKLDLEYIERRSVREDLTIMIKTIPVILFGRGAW
jgi:lipopolysaccharide/colanic/teichoic acid biosynthesis glycosyltransferase